MELFLCRATGCETKINPRHIFCPAHINRVPTDIKRQLIAYYGLIDEESRIRFDAALTKAIEEITIHESNYAMDNEIK